MSDLFDKFLHDRGRKGEELFFLNIGAMDGVLFDELGGYTHLYGFKGLFVEPIPYLFDRLKKNWDNGENLFENCAISDYNGEIEMITIDQDAIDSGEVHNCFYGMSAVYPPKNGLGSELDRPTVEQYGKRIMVPCMTLDNLISKHNIQKIDVIKIDTEGHDFHIFKQIDFEKYKPSLIRMEWINLTQEEQKSVIETFLKYGYVHQISGQDIMALPKEINDGLVTKVEVQKVEPKRNLTLVTGLWNIRRDGLTEGWSRSFEHYLQKFEQMLQVENNMIIFGDSDIESLVWKVRRRENTMFVNRGSDWFKNEFYDKIQEIRQKPEWLNQSSWLSESTQARLDMYNPLVMSKMFLLHDAKIMDPFNSEYMFWIDAGLTNTVHPGYFTHDKVLDKLPKYVNKFSFVCFPYEANTEIHGFDYPKINQITGSKVEMVARGGFFGGPKSSIGDINSIYYSILKSTLQQNLMGTEESIFSIMCYKHADLINYFEIDSNGLFGKFFEDLKTDRLEIKNKMKTQRKVTIGNTKNVALYVITFNSPKQVRTLIESMNAYDQDFVDNPQWILLNNSSDLSTTPEYEKLCEEFNIEHIKKDNLGICGGRQFIAEHAEENGYDFYFFFEDDMFFYPKEGEVCRNGLNRYVERLYSKSLNIINNNGFDFLKLSFTEFYGDNRTQWAWYNVPQSFRESNWPDKPNLPVQGLDPNAPKTKFNNINSYEGVPYADGEIYYCNWPQLVSKEGNKKMFLTETWARPFEQTWMSYMFQETIKGNLNPAILLMTPTEHDRFDHYDGKLRKES